MKKILALFFPLSRGATIGLLVSAAACVFIVYRLVQASAPVPTSLKLVNSSGATVQVQTLQLVADDLLQAPLSLPAHDAAGTGWESRPVLLAPGRPAQVAAWLSNPTLQAACELPPRPSGSCSVRAEFKGSAQLQCDYECAGGRAE